MKGNLYISPDDQRIHKHSGNKFVIPTTHTVLACASKLLRKVMLYPDPDSIDSPASFVVIDYNKPRLSLCPNDVVVPIYPKVGDMLEVSGDEDEA